jgi:hypothetical protein
VNSGLKEYQKLLKKKEHVAHKWDVRKSKDLYLLRQRSKRSKDQTKQRIELAKKIDLMWRGNPLSFMRNSSTSGKMPTPASPK